MKATAALVVLATLTHLHAQSDRARQLVERLGSERPRDRVAAHDALLRLGKAALPALASAVPRIASADEPARRAAAGALTVAGELGAAAASLVPVALDLAREVADTRALARLVAFLGEVGRHAPESRDLVARTLDDLLDETELREVVLRARARLRTTADLTDAKLRKRVYDRDVFVREAAARELRRRGARDAIDALRKVYRRPMLPRALGVRSTRDGRRAQIRVRPNGFFAEVAAGLRAFGDPEDLDTRAWLWLLHNEAPDERIAALRALGQRPDDAETTVAHLVAKLGDRHPDVVAAAAAALGALGAAAKEAQPALEALRASSDPEIGAAVADAIARIARAGG